MLFVVNMDKSVSHGFLFRSHCGTYLFSFLLSFYAIVKVKVTEGSERVTIVTVGPGSMQR